MTGRLQSLRRRCRHAVSSAVIKSKSDGAVVSTVVLLCVSDLIRQYRVIRAWLQQEDGVYEMEFQS